MLSSLECWVPAPKYQDALSLKLTAVYWEVLIAFNQIRAYNTKYRIENMQHCSMLLNTRSCFEVLLLLWSQKWKSSVTIFKGKNMTGRDIEMPVTSLMMFTDSTPCLVHIIKLNAWRLFRDITPILRKFGTTKFNDLYSKTNTYELIHCFFSLK